MSSSSLSELLANDQVEQKLRADELHDKTEEEVKLEDTYIKGNERRR